jgi:glycosyltransferase involved in cell wall biosynthesis
MSHGFTGKVLIVAEHASFRFGGEAALPLHYFSRLRRLGIPTWLVVHERTRVELTTLFGDDPRVVYIRDTQVHKALWRLGSLLPRRVADFSTGYLMRVWSQIAQRRIVRDLVRREAIDVVHQPMPVAPKEPSLMFDLGAPVVIGPLNGGMDYPPAFRSNESPAVRAFVSAGRAASRLLNRLMPGKLRADVVLVANERTRHALPSGLTGDVRLLCENGIDVALWSAAKSDPRPPSKDTPLSLLYMGRLVDWKGVDHLLQALAQINSPRPVHLTIAGDGPERGGLEALGGRLGLLAGAAPAVTFAGWKTQAECADLLAHSDALVLPSLLECGGAVVLEAMAAGKPVIATDWGGPADYLDPRCALLVAPTSRSDFPIQLAAAIDKLASSPELCAQMGAAGREKALREFDWDRKISDMLAIYCDVIARRQTITSQETAPAQLQPVS